MPNGNNWPCCDDFASTWLERYPRPRESTTRTYRYAVSAFCRAFSGRALDDISRSEARAWALDHRWALFTIRAMYFDAVRDGLVATNPCAALRIPQSQAARISSR